jgi:hypothetical protein
MADFNDPFTLGGDLHTRRMGIGSDAGISARALEWAFERGLNTLYWGTRRTAGMKQMIRTLAPTKRDQMIIALQSYDTTGLARIGQIVDKYGLHAPRLPGRMSWNTP